MASKALAFLLVAFILLSSKDPRMTYGLGGLDPAHSPVKAPAPVKSQLPPPPHPIAKPPTAPLMPPVRSKAVFHVTSVPGTDSRRRSSTTMAPSTQLLNHRLNLVARLKRHSKGSAWNLGLNYVSKRRVPNGPDPIHNRKAVKYRQPPGA
ncbi:hypothetical protein SAY87_004020 [Trapa incisa]|uniref:Uncharacterized protein n=1 Tax=Trapa incisa TaxID=236973 RepID=A0AAN7JPC8_9MYRT|nr:hypothetical protein SAY87_004020 [Trapa incisa]